MWFPRTAKQNNPVSFSRVGWRGQRGVMPCRTDHLPIASAIVMSQSGYRSDNNDLRSQT